MVGYRNNVKAGFGVALKRLRKRHIAVGGVGMGMERGLICINRAPVNILIRV